MTPIAPFVVSIALALGSQTPEPKPAPAPAPPPLKTQAPAAPASPEAAAFDAAMALKKQKKNEQAAQAFEAFAQQFPDSARVPEAQVEAALGWYLAGRDLMVLHRSNESSLKLSAKATKGFADFLRDRPKDPLAGRVQYLVGMHRFYLGDLAGAESAFDAVMTKYSGDAKYVPLALERRAAMRKHLLASDLALADLQRYLREYPKGESLVNVQKALKFAEMYEKPAPALQVEAWIQGGPLKLEDLRGKVVGVLFFATWCENCEKERTFILDLERRYGPAGFAIVGVMNHAKNQTVESVRAWLPKNQIGFPVLMDKDQATAAAYRETTIPDLALVDKTGKVRWQDNPSSLWDYTIETLLAEDEAAAAPK